MTYGNILQLNYLKVEDYLHLRFKRMNIIRYVGRREYSVYLKIFNLFFLI